MANKSETTFTHSIMQFGSVIKTMKTFRGNLFMDNWNDLDPLKSVEKKTIVGLHVEGIQYCINSQQMSLYFSIVSIS